MLIADIVRLSVKRRARLAVRTKGRPSVVKLVGETETARNGGESDAQMERLRRQRTSGLARQLPGLCPPHGAGLDRPAIHLYSLTRRAAFINTALSVCWSVTA